MKNFFLSGLTALLLTAGLTACSKDDDNPAPSPRNVKYEITGNYTGHLTVIINDNVSGNEVFTVTSLPWTKEKTYTANVAGIGIGGQSVVANPGLPGQTVTVKIYSGGTQVRTGTVTCDANGVVTLPSHAYLF